MAHLDQRQKFEKEDRKVGDQMTNRDHPDFSIVKMSLNTENSSGGLCRLAVTRTSVKDHQLTKKKKQKKKKTDKSKKKSGTKEQTNSTNTSTSAKISSKE